MLRGGDTARILDANLNRAAEAVRVIEEYARLRLNDPVLAAKFKSMRHGLAGFASKAGLAREDRLDARDPDSDPGRPGASASPLPYACEADLLAANFSRLFESLRVLAEYARAVPAGEAVRTAESLRFEAYSAEKAVRESSRMARLADASLYFILSGELEPANPADLAFECASGGADIVQMRGFRMADADLLPLAAEVRAAARRGGALFVLDDRLDLALASGSDGVHLGRADMPVREARRIAGPALIVGSSARSAEEAAAAFAAGADYAGIGTVYPSGLKPDRSTIGPAEAARACSAAPGPVFPIGGIGAAQIRELAGMGVRRACVSSALMKAGDPRAAAAEMKAALLSPRPGPGRAGDFGTGHDAAGEK